MKTLALVCAGVALLATGFYLQSGSSGVSAADQERCEQATRTLYADSDEAMEALLPRCNEPGTVAMIDARTNDMGADEAAQAIASANQGSLWSDFLGYALIGAGVGAFGAAFMSRKKQAKA